MSACIINIGYPKTGSFIPWDACRSAVELGYLDGNLRLLKVHFHSLAQVDNHLEIHKFSCSSDELFTRFHKSLVDPKSSWHGKQNGVYYLARGFGFDDASEFLRSDQCFFVTTRRSLLDNYVSARTHYLRNDKSNTLPKKFEFSEEICEDIVNSYALYHISLMDGLEESGFQSCDRSKTLSFLYDFSYNDPASILETIGDTAGILLNRLTADQKATLNQNLDFNEMKRKYHVPGEGLRSQKHEQDPGYYFHGRPGSGKIYLPDTAVTILKKQLELNKSARYLAEKYGFHELRADFYDCADLDSSAALP